MSNYKQILRYENAGISQRDIAKLLAVSRNTVSKVVNARKAIPLDWNQVSQLNEAELKEKLFPDVTDNKSEMYVPLDTYYLMGEL